MGKNAKISIFLLIPSILFSIILWTIYLIIPVGGISWIPSHAFGEILASIFASVCLFTSVYGASISSISLITKEDKWVSIILLLFHCSVLCLSIWAGVQLV